MSPHENSMVLSDVSIYKKPDWTEPAKGRGRVVNIFFNVNMAKQHNGLRNIAHEYDIDLDRLVPGQYVGFLNRRRTKIKLFTAGNLFAYLSFPKGASGEIGMETVMQIPAMFGGQPKIDYLPVIDEAFETPILEEGESTEDVKAGTLPWKRARKQLIQQAAEKAEKPEGKE